MKWSLYIGRPAGIKVFIHWTFILGWLLGALIAAIYNITFSAVEDI